MAIISDKNSKKLNCTEHFSTLVLVFLLSLYLFSSIFAVPNLLAHSLDNLFGQLASNLPTWLLGRRLEEGWPEQSLQMRAPCFGSVASQLSERRGWIGHDSLYHNVTIMDKRVKRLEYPIRFPLDIHKCVGHWIAKRLRWQGQAFHALLHRVHCKISVDNVVIFFS